MIVVADADPAARLEIAAVLREDDMVVVEAEDAQALARAAERWFDLAVVDADLPGASTLRGAGLDPEVPVVVVARSAGPLTDAVAEALGAVGVLRKPVDEDDLRTIVWNLC